MEKINLKKVKIDKDIVKWVNWLNDVNTSIYTNRRLKKHTIQSQKKFIKEKNNSKNTLLFKIYYNADFVGALEVCDIDKFHKTCEIGFFIGEKLNWGKGIATKAVKIAKNLMIKKYKMKIIYGCCYGKNIGSAKVFLNNNFKKVAVFKKFYRLNKNTKVRDDKIWFEFLI